MKRITFAVLALLVVVSIDVIPAAKKLVFSRCVIGSIKEVDMGDCIYAERCVLPVKTVFYKWDGDTLYTYSGTKNVAGYKTLRATALPKYPFLVPSYIATLGDTLIVGYKWR